MTFCSNCGTKTTENQKFCAGCGKATKEEIKKTETTVNGNDIFFESEVKKPKEEVQPVENLEQVKDKVDDFEKKSERRFETKENEKEIKAKTASSNLSVNKKIIIPIAVVAIIIIIIVGGKLFLNKSNSPEKVVNKFESAIINNDLELLKSTLYFPNEKITLSDEALQEFIDYITENKLQLKSIIASLNEDITMIDRLKVNGSPILFNDNNEVFALTIKNKNIFSTKYAIAIQPSIFNEGSEDDNTIADNTNVDKVPESADTTNKDIEFYIEKYKNKDFIIPDSNIKELTFKDLNAYNAEEIFIARNELYARKGYVFTSYPNLQKYFENKKWYKANSNYNDELLSEVEKSNINAMKSLEFLKMADEKYANISDDYVIADSDSRELTNEDIVSLNHWQLIVARNEIFARYGLEFSTKELMNHFKTKSWFVVDSSVGNDVALTQNERKNVQTILNEEKSRIEAYVNRDLCN